MTGISDGFRFLLKRPRMTESEWAKAMEAAVKFLANPVESALEDLNVRRWMLLAAIAEVRPLLFHGTSHSDIQTFNPRQSEDTNPFGAQLAVYATRDPLWAMFYAILDRKPPFSLHNGCFQMIEDSGARSDPYYFFSIERHALQRRAFSSGFIYFLPRETFVREPISTVQGAKVDVDHWASLEPVSPIAKIWVCPEDFPFLDQIRGHDDTTLWTRMADDPERFPWVDELYD